jgi:hypothetical protein
MATVLFFRPNKDLAMTYASSWLGFAVDDAAKRGYVIIDLVNEQATKENLEKNMTEKAVDVAILGGHGNSNIFTGYEQAIVMEGCVNDQIMAGTISHFLSCFVGQSLLPSMISKGAVATIGYQVDFQFMVNQNYAVEEDPYAEPFRDVTLTIAGKILDGAKLKDVWSAGIAKCDEWISKLWSKTGTDWAEVISALQHDRDGMIALGDKESYVLPPRKVTIQIPQLVGLAFLGWLLVTHQPII